MNERFSRLKPITINKTIVRKSISFPQLLTILFVALKLTNNIDWSWWWVLSPLWLPIVVILGCIGVAIIGGILLNEFILKK